MKLWTNVCFHISCSSIYQKPRFQHQQWWSAWIISERFFWSKSTHLERWAPTVWGEVRAQSKGQTNHDVFGKMIIAYMPWSKGVKHVLFFFLFFSRGLVIPLFKGALILGPWTLLSAWWSSRVAMNQQSTSRVQTYGTAQTSPIMSAIFNEAGESRLVCIWCTSKIQDDFGLFRHFLGLNLNPRPFTWVRNVLWPYGWVVLM